MKEQEIRNIAWIGQNVTRNKKGGAPMDWEKCKSTYSDNIRPIKLFEI